ncbi:MAG: zinc-ribbon domain-containing protein [Oscillospiraceae bacterium]|nr:zinc-ribbon domain-containing protein [Oscillospiraceae bacterium]
MLWRIFQALFSVLLIIGGLSGQLVLRGTNSGPALAVVGALWLVYDIYNIVTYLKRKDDAGTLPAQLSELQINSVLDAPCTIVITRDSNIVGAVVKHAIYINGTYIGDLKNGGSITAETQYKVNTVTSPNFPGKLIIEANGNEPVNLRFLAIANKKRQNLEIVSGATEIGAQESEEAVTTLKKEKKHKKKAQDNYSSLSQSNTPHLPGGMDQSSPVLANIAQPHTQTNNASQSNDQPLQEEHVVFCTSCGNKLADVMKFCPKCGARRVAPLKSETEPQTSPALTVPPVQSPSTQPAPPPQIPATQPVRVMGPAQFRLPQDAPSSAASTPGDEPNVRRAVGVFVAALALMIMIAFVPNRYVKLFGDMIMAPLFPLILGFGFFIAFRDCTKYRIIGSAGLALFALLHPFTQNSIQLFYQRQIFDFGLIVSAPIFGRNIGISFLRSAAVAAIAIGGGIGLRDKRKFSLLAVLASFVILAISLFFSRTVFRVPDSVVVVRTVFSIIINAGFFFLAALLARMMTEFRSKIIRISGGARAWCIIVAVLMGLSIIVNMLPSITGNFFALHSLLLIPTVVGMIMLATDRRMGFSLALIGAGMSVMVALIRLIPFTATSPTYIGFAFGGLANQLITWFVIAKAWRSAPTQASVGTAVYSSAPALNTHQYNMPQYNVSQITVPQHPVPVNAGIAAAGPHQAPPLQKTSTYRENDNKGMRMDNQSQSSAYWMSRLAKPDDKREAFVYYIFANESDAHNALLELPYIHKASDSGKLICDEVFSFGYYATTENSLPTGKWDAFVAGTELAHDMWKELHEVFTKHNGRKKGDKEPDANAKIIPSKGGNASNVKYVREDRTSGGTYVTYSAPNKADAIAFLSAQSITRQSYYVVVDTPEGSFGKDIQGIYQE